MSFQIPGNFHVATHSAKKQPDEYDFAHIIHEVTFGSRIRKISQKGIGTFNSLGKKMRRELGGREWRVQIWRRRETKEKGRRKKNRNGGES